MSVPHATTSDFAATAGHAHLLRTMPWGVVVLAPDGTVALINPEAEALWGVAAAAVQGRRPAQVRPAVLPEQVVQALQGPIRPDLGEFWLPHTGRWVALRAAPATDGQLWTYWEDVTERHRAQEAAQQLRVAERRAMQIITSIETVARNGHYEVDLASGAFYFSVGMFRLFGEEPYSFVPSLDFIDARSHPDDVPVVRQVLEQAVHDQQPYHYLRRIRWPNGEWRTLEAYGSVVCDAHGVARQLLGLVQDVTERVHAQAQVQQSNTTIQQMLNGSISAICLLESKRDARGTIVDFVFRGVNKAAEALNQKTAAQMLGRGLLEMFPGVREIFFDSYVRVVETGEPLRQQRYYPHEHYDHWFDVSAVKNGDGFIMTFHDITEQKQAELALRQSMLLVEQIMEASPDFVMVFDLRRNQTVFVNRAAYQQDEVRYRETLKMGYGQLLARAHPDDRESLHQFIDGFRTAADDAVRALEYRVVRGRDIIWYRSRGKVFQRDAEGMPTQYISVVQDITALKKAEGEVQEAYRQLAQRATDKYLALFNSMDQGFCIVEVLFDEAQQPVDFRYIDINPVFEQQSGMQNVLGRTIRELVPDIEPFWIELYGQVALTGESTRYVDQLQALGRWFEVHAFRTGQPEDCQVAVLFSDVTEPKRHEVNLAFLAELSDDLTRLPSAEALMHTIGAKIGAFFGLARCQFVDVDEAADTAVITHEWHLPGLPAQAVRKHRLADYFAAEAYPLVRAGQPVVVEDVQATGAHPALPAELQTRAYVTAPFVQDGQWRFAVSIGATTPRRWRTDEIELLRELTARIWLRLERARAEAAIAAANTRLEQQVATRTQELQRSNELLQSVFNASSHSIHYLTAVRNAAGEVVDFRYELLNAAALELEGANPVGQLYAERHPAARQTPVLRTFRAVVETGVPADFEVHYEQGGPVGWYRIKVVKLGEGIVTSSEDITDRKQGEAQRRQQQQQLFDAVLDAQEAERKRIAEGLHNGVGQTLFAAKLQLDQLRPLVLGPTWNQAQELLADAIRQTRAISHELMPAVLSEFGLPAALRDICHKLTTRQLRFQCEVALEELTTPLPQPLQVALYRIAQELAQNIVKHAHASEASLSLEAVPGFVLLRAEDNGVGFGAAPARGAGIGLRTIRDRVALLDGSLDIGSSPQVGTYVRIRIPLAGA